MKQPPVINIYAVLLAEYLSWFRDSYLLRQLTNRKLLTNYFLDVIFCLNISKVPDSSFTTQHKVENQMDKQSQEQILSLFKTNPIRISGKFPKQLSMWLNCVPSRIDCQYQSHDSVTALMCFFTLPIPQLYSHTNYKLITQCSGQNCILAQSSF